MRVTHGGLVRTSWKSVVNVVLLAAAAAAAAPIAAAAAAAVATDFHYKIWQY